jgi:hypothetical protein
LATEGSLEGPERKIILSKVLANIKFPITFVPHISPFTNPHFSTMKGIFNQHKNTLGINGIALPIASIIDGQATVTLPSGKKTHISVASLQSIEGEINFTTNEILPDPEAEVVAEKSKAPLFETENDQAS